MKHNDLWSKQWSPVLFYVQHAPIESYCSKRSKLHYLELLHIPKSEIGSSKFSKGLKVCHQNLMLYSVQSHSSKISIISLHFLVFNTSCSHISLLDSKLLSSRIRRVSTLYRYYKLHPWTNRRVSIDISDTPPASSPSSIHKESPSPIHILSLLTTPHNSPIHSIKSSPWSSPNVESQNPTSISDKAKASIFLHIMSTHPSSPTQHVSSRVTPLIPTDIPSSSKNEFFDLPLALLDLSQGTTHSSDVSLAQIMERLIVIPTTQQLMDLTTHMSHDIESKLKKNSTELRHQMDSITTATGHLHGDVRRAMQTQFRAIFKEMSDKLHDRDKLFL